MEYWVRCIYFTGLALLLRVLLRDRLWAAIGTVVAVNLQCFTGTGNDVIWLHPSSSILLRVRRLVLSGTVPSCSHTEPGLDGGVRSRQRSGDSLGDGHRDLSPGSVGSLQHCHGHTTTHDPCDDTPGSRIWPSSIMLFGTTALVSSEAVPFNRGVIDGQFLYGLFESILTFSLGCVPMSSLEWVYMLAFLAVTGTYLWPIARWLLGLRTRILPAGNDLLRFCLGSYV